MASALNIGIIGAGIVGVSCAEWLRRAGAKVTLFDRQGPAAGASAGNAGVLARSSVVPVTVTGLLRKAPGMLLDPMGPLFLRWSHVPRLLPWLLRYLANATEGRAAWIAETLAPLLADAVDQHRALAAGTPAERFLRDLDYVYLYSDRRAFESDGFGWGLRRRAGFAGEEMGAEALRDYDPHLNRCYRFALRMNEHGAIADPEAYVGALADWFVAGGGTLHVADVTDIRPTDSGAQLVANGETHDFDRLVLAAGAWSGDLARRLGHRVPLEAERGYHMEFHGANRRPRASYMVADAKVVAAPMDRALRIAGVVEFGGLTPELSAGPQRLLENAAHRIYPDIHYERTSAWVGFRPAPPDSLPYLGESPAHRGIFFAFGHQHVGLTAGAKTGRLLADMITGPTPNMDVGPFRIDRFD